MLTAVSAGHLARGVAAAAAMFIVLGTVAALWKKPLFVRMTPTGGFEVALLLLQSALAGVYVRLPLLVLLIGGALLLEYYEPVRFYVALGGAALLAAAVWLKLARPECLKAA